MRLLLSLVVSLALSGCAALNLTPHQSLYAAYGGYRAALDGAVAYAESPIADPAIVHRLNAINKSEPVVEAVKYGRVYTLCLGKPDTVVAGVDCKALDFSGSTVSRFTAILRGAAASLLKR